MRIKWKLTVACLKMFFREREAVFWTLCFPLFMILLFNFVKFDDIGKIELGIVNLAGENGAKEVEAVKSVQSLKTYEGNKDEELRKLDRGERDLVLIVPESVISGEMMVLYTNEAKPQQAQLGALLVEKAIDHSHSNRFVLKIESVKGRKLSYMDFLLPGVLAMSIMQMGIFSVSFVFVDLKKRGILRRLRVTPVHPNDFILAQVLTRLVVLMMQIVMMVGVGILVLHIDFTGSLFDLFMIGVLGAVVFLGMGFAIAGASKSEDQVAPIANIVTLPMLLLSGVFFSRSNLPDFVHTITDYFPLTFLADGMRSIAIDGASMMQVAPQMIGLAVWCVISVAIAVKMFRWE